MVKFIVLLWSLNSLSFWKTHYIFDLYKGADGVRVQDLNGDGELDYISGFEEDGVIVLGLGQGEQVFENKVIKNIENVEDVISGDFNNDGNFDLVSFQEGKARAIQLFLGSEFGEFDVSSLPVPALKWMTGVAVDLNNDSRLDLIVAAKGTKSKRRETGELGVLWNYEKGFEYESVESIGWPMSLSLDDGKLFLTDRTGPERGAYYYDLPSFERTALLTGETVMMSNSSDDFIYVSMRKPNRVAKIDKSSLEVQLLDQELKKSEIGGSIKSVAPMDYDGDGDDDIIFVTTQSFLKALLGDRSSHIFVLENPGNQTSNWKLRALMEPLGHKFDDLRVIDMDGDGDLDIVTTEERLGLGVFWLENPL